VSVHQTSTGRPSSAHARRHRLGAAAATAAAPAAKRAPAPVSPASLAATAAACERLESRALMSVSLGADGFTDITPSADSRIVYVSSSAGSDSNNGLSAGSPVKSLAKGMSLVRDNAPDHLLLKRGDAWTETIKSWSKSGRSAAEPIVLGNYGDPAAARPLIKAGGSTAFESSGSVDHLAVVGLHLWAHTREPGAAGFTSTDNFGFRFIASTEGLLIEDCVVDQFADNILLQGYYGDQRNVQIRRSVITDSWSPRYKSQGLYSADVDGLLLEDNVFDHNGWNEKVANGGASTMSHNAYIAAESDRVVVRGNVFADAASHGLQARAGGDITGNLFLRNPIHLSFGLVNGSTIKPGGVTGTVAGNVMLETRTLGGEFRGWAVELGNIKSATVRDNVIANDGGKGGAAAFSLGYGGNVTNSGSGVGINNLAIEDNVVRNWQQSISLSGGLKPGGSGYTSLNDLAVRDNDFQFVYWQYHRIVEHSMPLNRGEETWSDNRYQEDAAQTDWFIVGGSRFSFAKWKSDVEPTAKAERVEYSSPERGIATYQQSIGGNPSMAGFMTAARAQGDGNWSAALSTRQVVNYVRAGFDKPTLGDAPIGTPPSTTPTVPPTTPNPMPNPMPTTPQPTPTAPALVVSAPGVTVPEGGAAAFSLSLAAPPVSNVTVTVAGAAGGDGDLTTATAALTFTPADWNVARTVTLAAAEDADLANGTASFTLSSGGLAGATVTATEADNDLPAPASIPTVPRPTAPLALRADADTYVRDGAAYAAKSFGGASQLQLKQGAAGWNRQAYLRFDLSRISEVNTAKLRLFGMLDNSQAASAGFQVLSSADTTWTEDATTWNAKPTGGTTVHATGAVAGKAGKWYEVDLTSFLKAEKAAGRDVVTLVIRAAAASPATILFNSTEAASGPELVVS
jgi:hypothetical protein